jgi:hypothetical protein
MTQAEFNIRKEVQMLNDRLHKKMFMNKTLFDLAVDIHVHPDMYLGNPQPYAKASSISKAIAKPDENGNYYGWFINNVFGSNFQITQQP